MFPLGAILDIGSKLVDKFFPDPAQAEQAKLKLLEMQQNGELAQLNADVAEQHELTDRLKADMGSDSWLSKNIRPLALIAILVGYFVFAMMSSFGHDANESYVQLLGQWGMLIMSFYFGGRTLEKIIGMKKKEIDMGWLKKRFGEASTMSGLGVVFMVASAFAPQQYQMLVQGLAAALGVGGAVRADPGNK